MQIKLGREEIANKEGKSGYFQLNLAHTTRRRNQAPQPGAATRRGNQAPQPGAATAEYTTWII